MAEFLLAIIRSDWDMHRMSGKCCEKRSSLLDDTRAQIYEVTPIIYVYGFRCSDVFLSQSKQAVNEVPNTSRDVHPIPNTYSVLELRFGDLLII